MKIKRNISNILFNNALLSKQNLEKSDGIGYDYSLLCDKPEDCMYITVFDDIYKTDEILSVYKDGLIKDFLISRKCYKEFLYNTSEYLKRINSITQTGIYINIVSRCFVWKLTEEGGTFWSSISRDFSNYALSEMR